LLWKLRGCGASDLLLVFEVLRSGSVDFLHGLRRSSLHPSRVRAGHPLLSVFVHLQETLLPSFATDDLLFVSSWDISSSLASRVAHLSSLFLPPPFSIETISLKQSLSLSSWSTPVASVKLIFFFLLSLLLLSSVFVLSTCSQQEDEEERKKERKKEFDAST